MTDDLRKRVEQAAKALRKAGAREVYLFGSATTDNRREGSDVDLAVTGLPPEVFFSAMGQAGDILQCPLDLIDLDEDNPFTRYLKEEDELVRVS